jgi:hypothetical protein
VSHELPQLDQLRVASPCAVAWESMQGDDRARLCSQCQKHVYNLSEMTRHEIEKLVVAKEGKFCARFYRRPDGTLLTQDCPVGIRALRQRIWRAALGIAATLAAMTAGIWWGRIARCHGEDESSLTDIELVDNGPVSRLTTWVNPQMVMGFVCFPLPQMIQQTETANDDPSHGN